MLRSHAIHTKRMKLALKANNAEKVENCCRCIPLGACIYDTCMYMYDCIMGSR